MKRYLLILLLALLPVEAFSQAQIITRRERLKDFGQKMTLVVLTGNELYDSILRESVRRVWTASAYEFCTSSDFEARMTSPQWYFLVSVRTLHKGEAGGGTYFLTLLKGGAPELDKLPEVASLPVCPADGLSGREGTYMPAIIGCLQRYASEYASGAKTHLVRRRILRGTAMVDTADISPEAMAFAQKSGTVMTGSGIGDKAMEERTEGCLSTYTITGTPGSFCYKMVFDAGTHELLWLGKHRTGTSGRPAGFLKGDLRRFR